MDIVLIVLWYVTGIISSWMFNYFMRDVITRGDFVVAFVIGLLGPLISMWLVITAIAIWADKDDQPFIVRKKK